jgi:hypothetical protein
MEMIFSDCTIELLESDPDLPGVFVSARRGSRTADLSGIALWSVLSRDRRVDLSDRVVRWGLLRERALQLKRHFQRNQLRRMKEYVPDNLRHGVAKHVLGRHKDGSHNVPED